MYLLSIFIKNVIIAGGGKSWDGKEGRGRKAVVSEAGVGVRERILTSPLSGICRLPIGDNAANDIGRESRLSIKKFRCLSKRSEKLYSSAVNNFTRNYTTSSMILREAPREIKQQFCSQTKVSQSYHPTDDAIYARHCLLPTLPV
jgi:hypothetical protein